MVDLPYPMQIGAVAVRCEQLAADVRLRCLLLGSAVHATDWDGAAARQFRHRVADLTGRLQLAARRLDTAAATARAHAAAVVRAEDARVREGAARLGLP